ncbi:MAG: formylglycine-generating enzyme family protein, partial [Pirellulaceae bacterium]
MGRIGLNSCGFRVVLGFPVTPLNVGTPVEKMTVEESIESNRIINSIGMRFTLIPKGTFMMGSPEVEHWRSEDEALHEVILSRDYYLGIHEVTQDQYLKVTGVNPSFFRGFRIRGSSMNHPVEEVSWEDAVEFCKQLSEMPEEIK